MLPGWTFPGVGRHLSTFLAWGLLFWKVPEKATGLVTCGFWQEQVTKTPWNFGKLNFTCMDFGHSDSYRAVKKKVRWRVGGAASPGAFPCWFIFSDRKVLKRLSLSLFLFPDAFI